MFLIGIAFSGFLFGQRTDSPVLDSQEQAVNQTFAAIDF